MTGSIVFSIDAMIFKTLSSAGSSPCYLPIVLFENLSVDAARIKNAASRAEANKELCRRRRRLRVFVDEFRSICIADRPSLPSIPLPLVLLAGIKAKKYGNVPGYSDSFPFTRVHHCAALYASILLYTFTLRYVQCTLGTFVAVSYLAGLKYSQR